MRSLPEPGGRQEENERVGEQLRQETALLQAKLASVQQLHRAVTDVLLDERGGVGGQAIQAADGAGS